MRVAYDIFKTIFLLFIGVIILINLGFMYKQVLFYDMYPTLFGYGRLSVNDSVTAEDYEENDYIMTKQMEDYTVGQNVVYVTPYGNVVVDTITELDGNHFVMMHSIDGIMVFKSYIKGEVIMVSHDVGGFMMFVEGPVGTIIMLLLVLLVIDLPKLIGFIHEKKEERKGRRL